MTAPGWAKYAADDIVSDDDIDEADAEKSDSRDWLKWALGIGLLGAGAYGAYKYSPELKQQLGALKLVSTKTPVNQAVETATLGALSSPGWLGAGLGAVAATPAGMALSDSQTFTGSRAKVQTLGGQGLLVPTNKSYTRGTDPESLQANKTNALWEAAGSADTPRNWSQAGTKADSAISAYARLHKPGAKPAPLSPDTGFFIFGGRRQALRETQDLINNLRSEGAKLNAPVTYLDPATKTNVTRPLVEIADPTHAPKLTPEQVASWDLHRRGYEESGAGKATTPVPREKFDLARQATALEQARRVARPASLEAVLKGGAGYGLAGGTAGFLADKFLGY